MMSLGMDEQWYYSLILAYKWEENTQLFVWSIQAYMPYAQKDFIFSTEKLKEDLYEAFGFETENSSEPWVDRVFEKSLRKNPM